MYNTKTIVFIFLINTLLWGEISADDNCVFAKGLKPYSEESRNNNTNIGEIVDCLMGNFTIAEHYISGRLPAELLYFHGKKILPDDWWEQYKLLASVVAGVLIVFGNEVWEYYCDNKFDSGYTSPWQVIRHDPDTHTDIIFGLINLGLFTAERRFSALDGLVRIETHSPILLDHLNIFRGGGCREEMILSSKYTSFNRLQFGIALGHGEPLTIDQKRDRFAPSWFYRVFTSRKMGLEYVPGGPPMYGSYCGLSTQYESKVGKVPFSITCVIYTAENRKLAFRTSITILLHY